MSGRVKKRRNQLVKDMFAGKITEDEARRRYGGKPARKAAQADLVKMRQAQAAQRAQADQLTGIVKEAVVSVMKSGQPRTASNPQAGKPPDQPQQPMDPNLELQHRAELHPDPREREAARQALVQKGMLPGTPVPRGTTTTRALVWAAGPDGTFGWRPAPESRPLDLGILPPRS